MTQISFVYFDVGGVAIQDFSDSNKWGKMMDYMGVKIEDKDKFDEIYDKYETDICLGKRHVDTLIPMYQKELGLVLPDGFSMQQYFLDHFDPNPDLWPIVDKVIKAAKIGLLTDQYPGLLDGIFAKHILPPVVWDAIVDSSVVGVRKPMPEIYRIAKERAGVDGSEILFIDNRQKYVDGAFKVGWQGYWYDSRNYSKSNLKLADFFAKNL